MRFLSEFLIAAAILVASACTKSNDIDVDNGPSGNNDTPLPQCEAADPPTTSGATLMRVGRLDGTCAWMDRTEVTRSQYAAFLASVPADDANVPACLGHNPGFEPDGVDLEPPNLPVTGVDWCDAAAYCAWVGKSLCGTYKAGARDASEFVTICTDGDHAGFDYGELEGDRCNGGGASALAEVATFQACITPTLVVDLVGNAKEWVAECEGDGFDHGCLARGGAFDDKGAELGCQAQRTYPRSYSEDSLGFRCCAAD